MAFVAQYRGHCGDCDNPIEVGDVVFYASQLVHEVCPIERMAAVCDKCFLTKPCGCDD